MSCSTTTLRRFACWSRFCRGGSNLYGNAADQILLLMQLYLLGKSRHWLLLFAGFLPLLRCDEPFQRFVCNVRHGYVASLRDFSQAVAYLICHPKPKVMWPMLFRVFAWSCLAVPYGRARSRAMSRLDRFQDQCGQRSSCSL